MVFDFHWRLQRAHRFLLAVAISCLWLLPLRGEPVAQTKKPRLAVLIVFDQMRADYLVRWQKIFCNDGFERLKREGIWFDNCNYPYAHTVTAAGHASLATGSSAYRHGIVANEWYDRQSGKIIESVESDRYRPVPPVKSSKKVPFGAAPVRLLLPTLADALKAASQGKSKVVSLSLKNRSAILLGGKKPDACYWYSTSAGTFVTSTYYREKLHPWVVDYNRTKPANAWFGKKWNKGFPNIDYEKYSGPDDVKGEWDGYEQGRTFPHPMTGGLEKPGKVYYQAVVNSPFGNDLLFGLAKKAIVAEKLGQGLSQDLLLLSFSSNDQIGHCWGPDSQEMMDVTLRSDLLMKELLAFLDAKVGKGRYVLAMSADHGVCPLPEVAKSKGKVVGRISPTILGAKANQFLKEQFGEGESKINLVEAAIYPWVYLDRDAIKALKLDQAKVEQALATWLIKQPGIQTAYTRTQLLKNNFKNDRMGQFVRRSFHPDGSGDVEVVTKPYYLMTTYKEGTQHGTPHAYDTHVPLLIYGAGLSNGGKPCNDAIVPQTAVVMLAHGLGIKPPAGADAKLPRVIPVGKK